MRKIHSWALAGTLGFVTVALPRTSGAQAETLEVDFGLEQYADTGTFSFSVGCDSTPATGRTNWVHVTVVWLEDSNGNYVTTLHRWGRTYVYSLKRWALSSDMAIDGTTESTPTSDGNSPGQVFTTNPSDPADRFTTGVHDISWLPNGTYTVRMETTQCELAGEYRSGEVVLFGPDASYTFTKGPTSQIDQPLGTDDPPFVDVRVNYTVGGGNNPPGAWAGIDQTLPASGSAPVVATLTGVVDDESGSPTVVWTQVDVLPAGQGLTASIATPDQATTTVSFDTAGIYTFQLTATDGGGLVSTDRVTVSINAQVLQVTDDAEVTTGQANSPMGIIDNSGPWVFAWGPCNTNTNPTARSRGYFRFDLRGLTAPVTAALLRLPRGEASPNSSHYHDFYLLDDARDDWNTNAQNSDPSTDWEATITFNNQSVADSSGNNKGYASVLDPAQRVGSFQHDTCLWRHGFANPYQGPAPASECPGWFDVPIDMTQVPTYDSNNEWSFFATPRNGCGDGMGIGSSENLINSKLVVVEFWTAGPDNPPVAVAGTYAVVVDQAPTGDEPVPLDGSGSSDDNGITSYTWSEGASQLGSSSEPDNFTPSLPLGIHDITLTVSDAGGQNHSDTTQVIVEDRYYPNHAVGNAALIDGSPTGKLYDDLFAYTAAPDGDWYAIDLVDGSDLDVSLTMAGGNLDLHLYNPNQSVNASSATAATTETVSATGLNAGRYLLQVEAVSATDSTYDMTLTVGGPTLIVALNPASAAESAGTLSGAGTVSVDSPVSSDLTVTLTSEDVTQLTLGSPSVTITTGTSSASFDITLIDDPMGQPDANRYVQVSASATNYNPGSQTFEIIDDEATRVVAWDKAGETSAESAGQTITLRALLSAAASSTVTVPITILGTATAGSDYNVLTSSTEVSIPTGTEASVILEILNDDEEEEDETIVISIGTPTGATVGSPAVYTLTLTDDDTGGGGGSTTAVSGGCACSSDGDGIAPMALFVGLLGLALGGRRRRRTVR